ncbi:MAG: glycosyltransferase [Butyrivibrio sp.]|nr:glycosyltransferase [Butyrivibrio sp.]
MTKTARLEHLVSAVNRVGADLAIQMRLKTDAVIVNQCDRFEYLEMDNCGSRLRIYNCNERGVGLSRNTAILHAEAEISLISDEDIVYTDTYVEDILKEFDTHPRADMILFNVEQSDGRYTYHNDSFGRVHIWNSGRYPAYSIAVRTDRLKQSKVTFSTLFGGGAKYGSGEDSLFFKDALKAGLRIYKSQVLIGHEITRKSTWFEGYNEKYFFDKGVLYYHLYGKMAEIIGFIYLYRHKDEWCKELEFKKCLDLIKKGIKSAK